MTGQRQRPCVVWPVGGGCCHHIKWRISVSGGSGVLRSSLGFQGLEGLPPSAIE
jgi:hypothetical protein